MPLTKKGAEILARMKKEYGAKKGEQVFYASANKGTIKDVHEGHQKIMEDCRSRFMEALLKGQKRGSSS